MPIGKVWIYRLLFVCARVCLCVCTVMDFSAENKASGVKFCTAVYRRPRRGISHFEEPFSPEAQNRTNLPARGPPLRRLQQLPFGFRTNRAVCGRSIGMCGYTSVPEDGRTCWSFQFYRYLRPRKRIAAGIPSE